MAATYAMLARRRGRARALLTGGLNIAGAGTRLAWMAPLALLFPRWRGPAADNARWLRAHMAGLRTPDTLAPRG